MTELRGLVVHQGASVCLLGIIVNRLIKDQAKSGGARHMTLLDAILDLR